MYTIDIAKLETLPETAGTNMLKRFRDSKANTGFVKLSEYLKTGKGYKLQSNLYRAENAEKSGHIIKHEDEDLLVVYDESLAFRKNRDFNYRVYTIDGEGIPNKKMYLQVMYDRKIGKSGKIYYHPQTFIICDGQQYADSKNIFYNKFIRPKQRFDDDIKKLLIELGQIKAGKDYTNS